MKRRCREAVFQPDFLEELRHWVENDRKAARRMIARVEAIIRDSFTGNGKPEPVKHLYPGTWSRRITKEHRLVYLVRDDPIDLLQARDHD